MSRNELFECEVFFICLMPWVFVCTFFIHNRITASALISALPLRRTHTLFTLGWMHSNEIGLIVARRSSSVGNVKLFLLRLQHTKTTESIETFKAVSLKFTWVNKKCHRAARRSVKHPTWCFDLIYASYKRAPMKNVICIPLRQTSYLQSNCHLSTISCHRCFIY